MFAGMFSDSSRSWTTLTGSMPGLRTVYRDRTDAGRRLAARLLSLRDHPLVVGLPRGGMVVAREVALALDAPLEALVTRKLGAPEQPEWAAGAIAPGGILHLDERYPWDAAALERVVARERAEMERRIQRYDGAGTLPDVEGRTVVVVDDGIATGLTMWAALQALREAGAGTIVVAVPVCPHDTAEAMRAAVEAFVCPLVPDHFHAVGEWYEQFAPVSDEEVRACLAAVRAQQRASSADGDAE